MTSRAPLLLRGRQKLAAIAPMGSVGPILPLIDGLRDGQPSPKAVDCFAILDALIHAVGYSWAMNVSDRGQIVLSTLILIAAVIYATVSLVFPLLLLPFWMAELALLYWLHDVTYRAGLPLESVAYLILVPGVALIAAALFLRLSRMWLSLGIAWCIVGLVSAVLFRGPGY